MKRESNRDAARQTSEVAGALLEALLNGDTTAVEQAVARTHLLARMAACDAWTSERLELLDAVASAIAVGTGGVAAYRLLSHVAHNPACPRHVM